MNSVMPVTEKDIREDIAWAQINRDVLKSLERPRATYWLLFALCFAMFVLESVARATSTKEVWACRR